MCSRRFAPRTRSWGDESVCFRCNRTTLKGVSATRPGSKRSEWYCETLGLWLKFDQIW